MGETITLMRNGPAKATTCVILAHGAGVPMDAPFMEFFAVKLAEMRFQVVRFEFPYMAKRRSTGSKSPPNREPILRQTWLDVIERVSAEKIIIGGKSMGGRIASLIADEAQVGGLVCLGYPFHPIGRPEKLRVEHLRAIKTQTLVVQGERDPFGNQQEVARYPLSDSIQVRWLPDGDHSFKPRKSSGFTVEEHLATAVEYVCEFAGETSF